MKRIMLPGGTAGGKEVEWIIMAALVPMVTPLSINNNTCPSSLRRKQRRSVSTTSLSS